MCDLYLKARVCSGKPMTIVASREGFYPSGRRQLRCHSLVGLLQQLSRVFDAVCEITSLLTYSCLVTLWSFFALICANYAGIQGPYESFYGT